MKNEKLVSILIPVYNREDLIAETIESALAQTYSNVEIVIVDNASEDRTWEIIQKYALENACIKPFRNETNVGPVKNWKACVDHANGIYGKILWSDDLIAPTFIERMLPMLQDDVAFVYSGVTIFTKEPSLGKRMYFRNESELFDSKEFIENSLYDLNVPVSPGCALFRLEDIRKNLLVEVPNKVGSQFSMHAIGNDLLIFLLTAVEYKKVGFVAESLSFFRAHEGSISTSADGGKLPLHYALAKAFFVEKYCKESKGCYAGYLQVLLWLYPSSIQFGIVAVNDFFTTPIRRDSWCLVVNFFRKFTRFIKVIFKKYL